MSVARQIYLWVDSRYCPDAKWKIFKQVVPLLAIVIGTERSGEGIYKRENSILYPITVSIPFRTFFSCQVGVVLVSYHTEESHNSCRIAFSELPHSFHLEFLFAYISSDTVQWIFSLLCDPSSIPEISLLALLSPKEQKQLCFEITLHL